MTHFLPSRPDGRSDRRIIFELVGDAEPETLFGFEQLAAALQDGLATPVRRERIYRAVSQGNKTLLRERRRYLAPVAGQGYRMIRADEHLPMAIGKKSRAEKQIHDGIEILRNVRLDELTEPQRTMHVGQLMILDGVYRMAKASEKRHARQEQVLEDLRREQQQIAERLGRMEAEKLGADESVAAGLGEER
jgi:hypothetical protein